MYLSTRFLPGGRRHYIPILLPVHWHYYTPLAADAIQGWEVQNNIVNEIVQGMFWGRGSNDRGVAIFIGVVVATLKFTMVEAVPLYSESYTIAKEVAFTGFENLLILFFYFSYSSYYHFISSSWYENKVLGSEYKGGGGILSGRRGISSEIFIGNRNWGTPSQCRSFGSHIHIITFIHPLPRLLVFKKGRDFWPPSRLSLKGDRIHYGPVPGPLFHGQYRKGQTRLKV